MPNDDDDETSLIEFDLNILSPITGVGLHCVVEFIFQQVV